MKSRQEIAEQILAAAEKRFFHYGFGKTTMAEIAADCDMSPANIYRFFSNKQDIVAILAGRCFNFVENSLQNAVQRPELSAAQQLEEFARVLLESNFSLYAEKPKVSEAVQYITEKRTDLVEAHRRILAEILAEVLASGMQRGEFRKGNSQELAEFVLNSLVLFQYPVFVLTCQLEELRRNASGIARLLVRGLQ